EREFEGAGRNGTAMQQAAHGDQRILFADVLLSGDQAVLVLLAVAETQRIIRLQPRRDLNATADIKEGLQARAGADRPVMVALRADIQVAFQLRQVERGAAPFAFLPHAFLYAAPRTVGLGADTGRHEFRQPVHRSWLWRWTEAEP